MRQRVTQVVLRREQNISINELYSRSFLLSVGSSHRCLLQLQVVLQIAVLELGLFNVGLHHVPDRDNAL
jgi:hypothetical protein